MSISLMCVVYHFFCCIFVLPLSLQLLTSLEVAKTCGLVFIVAVVCLMSIQCLLSHTLFQTSQSQIQSKLKFQN